MNRRAFPWSRLGIDPTSDAGAIRKAYADALRASNPDEDIAGFADLRRARDQALRMASQSAAAAVQSDADEGELYGLGGLVDEDEDDPFYHDDAEADEDWELRPASPLGDPVTPQPELNEAQQRAQAAWHRLVEVLYPEGKASEEAVTHEQLGEGEAALEVLLARAEEAEIDEHHALDRALAELFADTWPRSAPFVEPANAVFHWLDEAGALEERWALRFLNQRLKGMRFHEKVQAPGHPLHKAWVELSRPGRAGLLDRLRVSRLDIHKLLVGIRERYPELESHLAPERVASWEGGGVGSAEGLSNARRGFGGALVFVLVFFALIRALVVLVGPDADGRVAEAPAVLFAPSDAEIDAMVAGVFGPGSDMAAMRAADPVFADQLRLALGRAGDEGEVRDFVRQKALQGRQIAKFEALVAIAELKRLWLSAAQGSPDLCRNVMVGDFRSQPLRLDKGQAARESELLRRLLDAKVLGHDGRDKGGTFSVPGWAVERTLKRSGLPDTELTAALKNPEHPQRCLVEMTLLGVILEEPGRVSPDLLRGL